MIIIIMTIIIIIITDIIIISLLLSLLALLLLLLLLLFVWQTQFKYYVKLTFAIFDIVLYHSCLVMFEVCNFNLKIEM